MAREPDVIDRIRRFVVDKMKFEQSRTDEKKVEDNIVQLDLLADFPRTDNNEPVRRIQGTENFLDRCLVDGVEDLREHVETIRISWLDGNRAETCVTIPDPVGFLILKTEVCRYRQKSRDPYDIYYYCRFSEEPGLIRQKLETAIGEPAVRRTVDALQRMFRYEDSKWVDLALDEMKFVVEERDREAQFIVRAMARVVENL